MTKKFDYIDSDTQLVAFSRRIESAKWMAVDTEFMRERTYYAQLALIQIATEDSFALVDAPALTNLEPLVDAFSRSSCLKIMHSASQDLEVLHQMLGVMPAPLFDTQIAASFLGEADQISYAAIVKQRMGVELTKDQTRTNWLQRPLSQAQLGYAEADVLYLHGLYVQLTAALKEKGRLEWVQDESRALGEKTKLGFKPELAWQRLKMLSRLNPAQQQTAIALARWREERAQTKDLPREWILGKHPLSLMAKAQPRSLGQLKSIEGLSEKLIQRFGRQFLGVIEQAQHSEAQPIKGLELSNQQRAQAKTLMAWLRERGAALEIAPSLIANRVTIEKLVSGDRDLALLSGWRAQVAGDELLGMLQS